MHPKKFRRFAIFEAFASKFKLGSSNGEGGLKNRGAK
jgi:hypothetical protein